MQVLEWAASSSRAGVRRRAAGHGRASIRRRTSPTTRSAARQSWPTPTGTAAITLNLGVPPAPGAGGGAHGGAHHLSVGARPARQVRPPPAGPRRRSPTDSRRISRWKATCATRASPSSSGSTPTRTSTSPARWTISTSRRKPRRTGAGRLPSADTDDTVLRHFVHQRLAVPDGGQPQASCSALNAVAANVSFAEIETRSRPRRLPARRAGIPPGAGRFRRRRGGPSRAAAQGRATGGGEVRPMMTESQRKRHPRRPPAHRRHDRTGNSRVLDVGCGDGTRCSTIWSTFKPGRRARHRARHLGRRERLRQRPGCR